MKSFFLCFFYSMTSAITNSSSGISSSAGAQAKMLTDNGA